MRKKTKMNKKSKKKSNKNIMEDTIGQSVDAKDELQEAKANKDCRGSSSTNSYPINCSSFVQSRV